MEKEANLEAFWNRAMNLAEKHGTEKQQDIMAYRVALHSQTVRELDDFRTGKRDPRENRHHPIHKMERDAIGGVFHIHRQIEDIVKKKL